MLSQPIANAFHEFTSAPSLDVGAVVQVPFRMSHGESAAPGCLMASRRAECDEDDPAASALSGGADLLSAKLAFLGTPRRLAGRS